MERDDAIRVGGRLDDEVDDDPGFLARVGPHDPADPLLVDPLRRGRREVHADRRARRVPALGEQHRVDQDVDLAPLVRGERLREPDGRSLAGDGLGLEPGGAELLREVVGVVDASRVDDSGRRVEALPIEAGGGLVQSLMVERGGERPLLEVAAHDRDGVDRRRRREAEAAKRGDQAAPRGVRERKVVDGSGEDVRDLLRDQLLGGRHPDEDRLGEAPDRRTRLLAERRVRLVADHELVGLPRDRVDVAGEPGVGLDRDRIAPQRLLPGLDRVGEAVAVPLRRQVVAELGDEEAAMGEDQDSERASGLDEPGGCDRLPRGGRMPEAIAALGARVLTLVLRRQLLVVLVLGLAQLVVLVDLLLGLGVPVAVAVLVFECRALIRGDQLGEHPGERVDLMPSQLRTRRGGGRLRGEDPLEPEHQPEADLPARRRSRASRVELGERLVECECGARCLAPALGRAPLRGGGRARRPSRVPGARRPAGHPRHPTCWSGSVSPLTCMQRRFALRLLRRIRALARARRRAALDGSISDSADGRHPPSGSTIRR